uniref:hypothetical protein n=1 Tax=Porphyridium aerugineum TaxID=2792 RepID=UPI001FCE1183|nr:hypothetical protein MW505_pgp028 [Porphyridium aerugineum]UNJ17969.1 hypothetical protein [Porphyridium aerugineum]
MYLTKLNKLLLNVNKIVKRNYNNTLSYFAINLISLLLGFFIANALATLPGQTGDWGLVVSGILVAITETVSKLIYSINKEQIQKHKSYVTSLTIINNIKIGVIYGFFVDSFKLGS